MTEKERKIANIIEEITTWEYAPVNELIGNVDNNVELMKRLILIGPTQVGKTTLITDLIGIKTDEKAKVDKLLRGGTKQGRSSTSTAVIYSRSPEKYDSPNYNKFGWAIGKLTDNVGSLDFRYYSEEELTAVINNVNTENRSDGSYENSDSTQVTYIYIPSKYFNPDAPKRLHLVDLPGFGDRSGKMQQKIRSTLESLSDFTAGIVAVVPADNINSLSNIYREFIYDKVPESVLVTVTYSVSRSDEIKRIVAQSKDTGKLETEIREHYGDKIGNAETPCNHDPERFKERIFPIEAKNWLRDNGYDSIKELADYQKKSILDAIGKMECKTGIDICFQNISKRIADDERSIEEAKQRMAELEEKIVKSTRDVETCRELLRETDNNIKSVNSKKNDRGIIIAGYLKNLDKEYFRKTNDFEKVKNELWHNVGQNEKYDVNVKGKLKDYLIRTTEEAFRNLFTDIHEDYSQVLADAVDESVDSNPHILDPERRFSKRIYGIKWSEKAAGICPDIQAEAVKAVRAKLLSDVKKQNEKVDGEVNELMIKKRSINDKFNDANRKLKKCESEKADTMYIIERRSKDLEIIREKKEHITEVFIRHFNRKFSELTRRINNETDPDIISALMITQSTIANNMKGTIKNHV